MAYIQPKNLTVNLIKKQVIRVEKLVGENNKFRDVVFKKQRLFDERKKFEEKERKIEDLSDGQEKQVGNKFSVPKLGFLDIVKNFLFKVLLGAFTIKILPHLPKLKGVLIGALKFSEFIVEFGGSLLNAMVTFIDKVYRIVDFGKQQAKLLGGDRGLENYNRTLDLATKVMNSMFIAGMLFSDLVESDARGSVAQQAVETVRDRVVQQGAQRASQQGALRVAGQVGARAAVGIVGGVGLISSALGEGMFQLRKFTTKIEKDAYTGLAEAQKDPNPFMRFLKVGFYNTIAIPGMRFYNFISNGIGTLLDVIGAPFRYAIELINFGIMSLTGDAKGIKTQRENLGKLDARIREQLRQIVNVLSFGTLAKKQGSFGSLFGDQAVKSMGYASGGPVTRGGVYTETVTRTVGKKVKAKRVVEIPTTPLQPGIDVGGTQPYKDSNSPKIQTFYSKPNDPGTVSSFKYLEKTYDIVGTTKFLHPILEMGVKTLFGDKPSESDYKAVGGGLNNFFNNLLDTTKVPGTDSVISDETGSLDISNWVTRITKESISSSIDSILKDLMNQLTLKVNSSVGSAEKSQQSSGSGSGTENPLAQFGGTAQFVIGDSIAHGFAGRTGSGTDSDDTKVGRNSAAVLSILKARGDVLKGVLVDLSTGIANSTDDWSSVEAQFSYLKSIGARVRILGVGNDFSKSKGGINEKLAQLASKYGFYFYGGYKGGKDKLHGTDEDYANLKIKRDKDISTPDNASFNNLGNGKGKQIYLHWTAGGYQSVPRGSYHTIITGDGKIHRVIPYDQRGQHTEKRNSNSVGLSVAAMGGNPEPWSIPVKSIQYQKMAEESAKIAKAWGWKPSDVNVKNVMTHAEAGSNKDGRNITDNYGPRLWGGTGERWDLFQLYKKDSPGSGGDSIRNMIKGMMFTGGYIDSTGYYITHPGEYVVDADSVELFGIKFYDLINQVETISQRKMASENLISILSQYTEDGYPETEEDYTYYVPESSSVTIVPPMIMSIYNGSNGFSGSAEDPSQDDLFM